MTIHVPAWGRTVNRYACAVLFAITLLFFTERAHATVLFSQTPTPDLGRWSTSATVQGYWFETGDDFEVPVGEGWRIDLVRVKFTFLDSPYSVATAKVRVFTNAASNRPDIEVCTFESVSTNQTESAASAS
ncbi:MAG TPA: hypothetical protein VM580_06855 [Labilithrix sp.]|nr:hypothetical protein [Labilithrix sp.]